LSPKWSPTARFRPGPSFRSGFQAPLTSNYEIRAETAISIRPDQFAMAGFAVSLFGRF
jgi:hypothetical protein